MNKLKHFITDKTVATILLTIVLIVTMGSLRPDKNIGMYPDKYWAIKIHWEHCADGVITGDSRALMGVSPEELQKVLPYHQIRNFAFGANWYSRQYLEACEAMFSKDAKNRVVFMGISPHSLTYRKTIIGHYLELKQMSKQDAFLNINFGGLVNFFQPMSFNEAVKGLFPKLFPVHTKKNYRADGWVEVHKEPLKLDEVKRYRKIFEDRRVSQDVVDTVIEFVAKWRSQGIEVYGFIVPTCPQMVDVEKQLSGFNQDAFVAGFKKAGGTWIDVDLFKYECFDGSHLQDIGALQFSKDLAVAIDQARSQNADKAVTANQ